jgi:hypothetical protein
MVHYSEGAQLGEGVPTQVSQYEISDGKILDKTEKHSFTMRVSNNIHNIPCLDEAEFCQEWTEIEKIPVKASPVTVPPKPAAEEKKEGDAAATEGAEEKPKEEPKPEPEVIQPEQQYETKEKKKKTFAPLSFTTSNFALSPQLRRDMKDIEDALTRGDMDILEQKELRNNLEAYSYEMRGNLDSYGTFEKYLDEATKKTFMAEINEVVEWLYADGENAPKEEYRTRLEKFRAIGDPVRARHFYYSELDIYFGQFDTLLANIASKVDTIIHLTDEQKETIAKKVEVAQGLVNGVKEDRAAKQLYENPKYNLDQIITGLNMLKAETEAIFNAPPPKPKEEPKEDVKMEDEKTAEAPAAEGEAPAKEDVPMTE